METTFRDILFGLRMLRKNIGFTTTALVALMLGIASATAVFSVINGVLLRALPYPDANRIVTIAQTVRATGAQRDAVSPANFLDWAKQSDVFAAMAAARSWQGNLSEGDVSERLRVTMVTASFFQVFAVQPILGRVLQPADEKSGHANVAVLSFGLWQRRFASDRNIVGREIRFDGEPRTIVGVMPPDFSPDDYAEFWVPSPFGVPTHALRPNQDPRAMRDRNFLDAYARIKPGVTLAQAQTQMSAVMARLEEEYPNDNGGEGIVLTPLQEDRVGGMRPALLMLGGAVAFLLLIGCANVANLQLARAAARAREVSIRAALGADRKQIIRQLLTESVLLSVIGGALGILLAVWAVPVLRSMAPPELTGFKQVTVDPNVLGFSLVVSVLTGVLFGLAPAFQASSTNPAESLGSGDRGSTPSHNRSRSILITMEVALTLVLLIAAGLMIKSFGKLMEVDPGFNPRGLLVFDIGLPPSAGDDRSTAFYQQVLERLRQLPGVAQVGAVSRLPFSGGNSARSFNLPGGDKSYEADIRISTPEYFRTMGIPLRQGRVFNEQDAPDSPRVCVINEAAARAFFPNVDPIGKIITNFGENGETLQIVGVIGNVRHIALDSGPRPELYQPLGQGKWPRIFVVVRAVAGNPLALLPSIQHAVWSVDRSVALGSLRSMDVAISRSLLKRKFTMTLLTIFAGIAFALASIGLYGVMSYSVSQSTRELGVRMALGAGVRDVLRLVMSRGLRLTIAGVVIGGGAALLLTRLMGNLLYKVSPRDPIAFGAALIILIAVALLACFLPARRATRIDPVRALRI